MNVASSEQILSVTHLTMRFGGLVAVDDLSFSARRGEITALIGPNGAGKTTVFNCITGFYKPTTGMLRLVHTNGEAFLLERLLEFRITRLARVARTFQNIRLFPGMTALENLMVAQHNPLMAASGLTVARPLRRCRLAARREGRDRQRQLLARPDRADATGPTTRPAPCPMATQRRLEIARAMCTEPALLCLDEPAAGLNARESAELNELLLFDPRRPRHLASC